MTLTHSGARFHSHALKMRRGHDDAMSYAADLRSGAVGFLRVGASRRVYDGFLSPAFVAAGRQTSATRDAHPPRYRCRTAADARAGAGRHRACAIVRRETSDIDTRRFGYDELSIVARAAHPFFQRQAHDGGPARLWLDCSAARNDRHAMALRPVRGGRAELATGLCRGRLRRDIGVRVAASTDLLLLSMRQWRSAMTRADFGASMFRGFDPSASVCHHAQGLLLVAQHEGAGRLADRERRGGRRVDRFSSLSPATAGLYAPHLPNNYTGIDVGNDQQGHQLGAAPSFRSAHGHRVPLSLARDPEDVRLPHRSRRCVPALDWMSLRGASAILEVVGGGLLLIGLFSRARRIHPCRATWRSHTSSVTQARRVAGRSLNRGELAIHVLLRVPVHRGRRPRSVERRCGAAQGS